MGGSGPGFRDVKTIRRGLDLEVTPDEERGELLCAYRVRSGHMLWLVIVEAAFLSGQDPVALHCLYKGFVAHWAEC